MGETLPFLIYRNGKALSRFFRRSKSFGDFRRRHFWVRTCTVAELRIGVSKRLVGVHDLVGGQ
jgi:hypothetical protein